MVLCRETQEFVTKKVDSGQVSTVKEKMKAMFRGLVLRPERICNDALAKSKRSKRQLRDHLTVRLINLSNSKIFIIVNKYSTVSRDSMDWTIVH